MFEQLTDPAMVAVLAFGLTEIAKRAKAPLWVLNVLPTVVGLGIGALYFMTDAQVATFNEVLSTGVVGFGVTCAYKGLSGLIAKAKIDPDNFYLLLRKAIKELKQK